MRAYVRLRAVGQAVCACCARFTGHAQLQALHNFTFVVSARLTFRSCYYFGWFSLIWLLCCFPYAVRTRLRNCFVTNRQFSSSRHCRALLSPLTQLCAHLAPLLLLLLSGNCIAFGWRCHRCHVVSLV